MIKKNERNVFITGVSSGLGYGLAASFLRQGATVWGLSRRTPVDLTAVDQFRFIDVDLTDTDAATSAIARLLSDAPHLDLAILNAGVLGSLGDISEAKLDDLKRVVDVNLWANKTAMDAMFSLAIPISQVVTISSGAAISGNRGWRGYAISKAALNMLTKLYSAERPDTHFCALAPGLVDTAMQGVISHLPEDERFSSFAALRSKRNTPEMPSPMDAAEKLMSAISRLPDLVPSGAFADVRKLPA